MATCLSCAAKCTQTDDDFIGCCAAKCSQTDDDFVGCCAAKCTQTDDDVIRCCAAKCTQNRRQFYKMLRGKMYTNRRWFYIWCLGGMLKNGCVDTSADDANSSLLTAFVWPEQRYQNGVRNIYQIYYSAAALLKQRGEVGPTRLNK
jgi:hypothetical protein